MGSCSFNTTSSTGCSAMSSSSGKQNTFVIDPFTLCMNNVVILAASNFGCLQHNIGCIQHWIPANSSVYGHLHVIPLLRGYQWVLPHLCVGFHHFRPNERVAKEECHHCCHHQILLGAFICFPDFFLLDIFAPASALFTGKSLYNFLQPSAERFLEWHIEQFISCLLWRPGPVDFPCKIAHYDNAVK